MSYIPVERILGNVRDYPVGSREVERITIASDAMALRLLRLTSSIGDLGIRLSGTQRLRDGDVIYDGPERVIAVRVTAETVLVVRPATIAQAIDIAHALGNRHLPIQREGENIVVRDDPAVAELIEERGLPYERTARVLPAAFVHAHAPHGH